MARKIVIWPEEVLDSSVEPVRDFQSLPALLEEMHEVVVAEKGIGLAANQIGVPLRVALVGRGDGTFLEVVNPELLAKEERVELEEGCLSIPGEFYLVPRYRKVRVRYQDRQGETHVLEAEDRLAHVLQHEIDHLDGEVYAYRLSALKRDLIRQRMRKLKRTRASEPG